MDLNYKPSDKQTVALTTTPSSDNISLTAYTYIKMPTLEPETLLQRAVACSLHHELLGIPTAWKRYYGHHIFPR